MQLGHLRVRLMLAVGLCSTVLALGACSSSSTPVAPARHPTPTPSPSVAAVAYTAIGASDAVGYGASVPCTVASPAAVADPTCPETGASGYVPDLARSLASGATVKLDDLGISGAVLGPDILALVNTYGTIDGPTPCQPRTSADAVPADFITNELPNVGSGQTLVTIFAGGNDVNGLVNALACGAGGTTTASQSAFVSTWVTNFGTDLQTLISGVKSKSPSAKIVIANLPNFGLIPFALAQSSTVQQALASVSVALDQNDIDAVASSGIPVVDLLCNPQSYVAANFYTDGFHPNDAGYATLAASFLTQIQATAPVAPNPSCSYASQSSVAREPLSRGSFRAPR